MTRYDRVSEPHRPHQRVQDRSLTSGDAVSEPHTSRPPIVDAIATPVDWRPGDRVIVPPSMSTENARATFQNVEEVKPYLRYADAPLPDRLSGNVYRGLGSDGFGQG